MKKDDDLPDSLAADCEATSLDGQDKNDPRAGLMESIVLPRTVIIQMRIAGTSQTGPS
jgi:hypothetical protein